MFDKSLLFVIHHLISYSWYIFISFNVYEFSLIWSLFEYDSFLLVFHQPSLYVVCFRLCIIYFDNKKSLVNEVLLSHVIYLFYLPLTYNLIIVSRETFYKIYFFIWQSFSFSCKNPEILFVTFIFVRIVICTRIFNKH